MNTKGLFLFSVEDFDKMRPGCDGNSVFTATLKLQNLNETRVLLRDIGSSN